MMMLDSFLKLKEALGFTGSNTDFVYGMCIGFDGLNHLPYESYEHIGPILEAHKYEFMEGEDYVNWCWGVFKIDDLYFKSKWEYCSVAYEHDYWKIIDTLKIVKPTTKTVMTWEDIR